MSRVQWGSRMRQHESLSWSCCRLTETQRGAQCIFVELGGGLRKPCKELMRNRVGGQQNLTQGAWREGGRRTEKRREGRKDKGREGRGREGRSKERKEGGRDAKKEERKERRQARRKVSWSHFCTETFSWLLCLMFVYRVYSVGLKCERPQALLASSFPKTAPSLLPTCPAYEEEAQDSALQHATSQIPQHCGEFPQRWLSPQDCLVFWISRNNGTASLKPAISIEMNLSSHICLILQDIVKNIFSITKY